MKEADFRASTVAQYSCKEEVETPRLKVESPCSKEWILSIEKKT